MTDEEAQNLDVIKNIDFLKTMWSPYCQIGEILESIMKKCENIEKEIRELGSKSKNCEIRRSEHDI